MNDLPMTESDYMARQANPRTGFGGLQGMAHNAGIQGQLVKPPLAITLDETHELLCKCEQQARDLADRILGPRPEAALAGSTAPLTGPESNSLRRSADHLRARANAIGQVLERISTGI